MKLAKGAMKKGSALEILIIMAGGCVVGIVFNAVFGNPVMDPGGILGGMLSGLILMWLT